MRIVHFSDIHAAGFPRSLGSWFGKRAFGAVNYLLRRRGAMRWSLVSAAVHRIRQLNPDVVVISGDIATLGEPDEFAAACDALAPLVVDERFELFYVPGNHDRYVAEPAAEDALADAFARLNRQRWGIADLPVSTVVGPLRFVLFDEAIATPVWSCRGRLDDAGQRWLREELPELAKTSPVVSIAHFPTATPVGKPLPWQRRCEGVEPLATALAEGTVRLGLCGHEHAGFIHRWPGGGLECCAGSLTETARVNIVDYDAGNDRFHQQWLPINDGPGAEGTPLPVTIVPEPGC